MTALRKRRLITLTALCATAAVAAACSSSASSSTSTDRHSSSASVDKAAHALLPASITSDNTITVASSIGFAPFEFYGDDGKTPTGIDVDLMHAIEPVLGVKFAITDVRYPNILPSLQAKRYDIGWSAFGENPDAAKVVDFVTYLSDSSGSALVSAGNHVSTVTDLCGKSVGQVSGEPESTITALNDACVKAGKPKVQEKMFQKTADIVLALESGQLDARFSGSANGGYIAAQSRGKLTLTKAILPPVKAYVGVVALKGQEPLLQAITTALQVIVDNGQYATILKKWSAQADGLTKITFSS